jgi:hypothetical protein
VVKTLIYGIDAPGYASTITIMLVLGGVQLIGIGVMGEYIGRLYMESKRRPTYIIEEDSIGSPSIVKSQDDSPSQ